MSKRPTYADLTAHGLRLESSPDREVYRYADRVHVVVPVDGQWEVALSLPAARYDALRRAMPHRRQVVVLLDLQDEDPDRDLSEYASIIEGLLTKESAIWMPVPLGVTVWESWREFVQDLKEGRVTGEEEAL